MSVILDDDDDEITDDDDDYNCDADDVTWNYAVNVCSLVQFSSGYLDLTFCFLCQKRKENTST